MKSLISPMTKFKYTPVEVLTDANAKDVLKNENLIMVDCWASFCAPCKFYKKILETVDSDYKIYTLDIEAHANLSSQLGIRNIPTSIFFKDGEEVKRLTGIQGKQVIEQNFKELQQ